MLGLLTLVLLLVGGALVALRFPSVQTRVAHKVAAILTDKLQHQVTIGRVDVRPFSHVLLDQVRVLDTRQQELFNIGRLDADISLFSIFDPTKLHIGTLKLVEPRFAMVTYAGTNSTNLDSFLHRIQELVGPSSDTTKSAFDFKIHGITLENGRFILDDQNEKPVESAIPTMDYAHMRLDSIYGELTDIELTGDTIRAQVNRLRTVDRRANAHLHELTARMTWSPTYWEFAQPALAFNQSTLRGPLIRFDYHSFLRDFPEFIDSVQMNIQLDTARVLGRDLTVFAPQIHEMFGRDTVRLHGEARGTVANFRARNLDLRYNSTSRLLGSIGLDGLPEWQEMVMDISLKPGTVVDPRDIRQFVPADAYTYLERLGRTRARGQFQGYYNDFVANGAFQTALGDLVSDINLKIRPKAIDSRFSGTVRTTGFQLGRLIGDPKLVQTVSLNGHVEGRSFDIATMRLTTDLAVQQIGLMGYNYRNLTARGTMEHQTFTGRVTAADPNLRFAGNGTVTFDPKRPAFNLKLDLTHADLRALGFVNDRLKISTRADLNFRGLTLDALVGTMRFLDTRVTYDTASARIDTLNVDSRLDAVSRRTLAVHSEVLDLRMAGDFRYTDLLRDVTTLVREYALEFEANRGAIDDYYRRKRHQALPDYRVDLALLLRKPNPLLHVFVPELTIADSTAFDGFFRTGQTSILQLGGDVAYLSYGKDVSLTSNRLEINTSKLPYSDAVLASAFVTSKEQRLPGLGLTEKLAVEAVWNQGAIDFSSSIKQQKSTNAAQLNGALRFLEDAVEVRVAAESGVNVLGQAWRFSPNNRIVIAGAGREIQVEHLDLRNGPQRISAIGALSARDPTAVLTARVDSFQLASLNPLFGADAMKIGGVIQHARVDIRNVFGREARYNARLRVDSLRLDSTLIGDVRGQADWDNALGRLGVNAGIERDKQRLVSVTGFYAPSAPAKEQLALVAMLEGAPLKLVEPFLSVIMDRLEGTMNGRIDVTGAMSAPTLRGAVDVTDGRFRFGYLNTTYRLSGPVPAGFDPKARFPEARIVFDDKGIRLRNLLLRDELDNQAVLDGTIYEQGFQDMLFDIRASFRRFMVLNTTRRENDLYYGTAFATGRLAVNGTPDDIVIDITAKTDAGTRLAVPLDNQAEVSRSSFIKFVAHRPGTDSMSVTRADSLDNKGPDLSGLQLTMNVDVTPDAQMEIIFDERTGDIIRGTGQGRVTLDIDTRGNFNMYGNIEIVRGLYNFTLLGVVNKEFNVRPGGTISWNGDPYGGELNLSATYTQKTSLAPILQGLTEDNANVNTAVPVTAIMSLKGSLLSPDIKLGLDFPPVASSLESVISAFANEIRNDEQELNRQVFSLLVLKRLSPRGEFAVGSTVGNNAFSNSVGELLSAQLSYWISQLDTNLEIDLGLAGFDQAALEAMQVRVSYSLFNGRLRLTREGGVSGNTGATTGTGAGAGSTGGADPRIGDISAEYYIRPDGRLRLKLSYETTSRDIQRANTARQNASLVHTQQFDNFGELFRRSKLPRKYRRSPTPPTQVIDGTDDDPRTSN